MSSSDHDQAGELLIQEVDEELRHEQYRRLWQRYGNAVIALAVGVIALVAGTQGWQGWQSKRQHDAAARFSQAQSQIGQGNTKDALATLTALAEDGTKGFALAARMRAADLLTTQGDKAGAAAIYDQIASSDAPQLYRDLAVLKAALLTMDDPSGAAWEQRLAGLTAEGNAWRASALEVQGLMALKKGDQARAVAIFKQLADDLTAPASLRARAAELLAVENPQPAADKTKG